MSRSEIKLWMELLSIDILGVNIETGRRNEHKPSKIWLASSSAVPFCHILNLKLLFVPTHVTLSISLSTKRKCCKYTLIFPPVAILGKLKIKVASVATSTEGLPSTNSACSNFVAFFPNPGDC